ncbi:MAG: cytosine permease [Deltaproteobacteria bacterium]|nr:cytosine permease [Deltaproteobacteria bacterium]
MVDEKKFEIGSDDFSLEKVPEHARAGWLDISLIYTGFTIIPTGIMLGAVMGAHFPFWKAFWIILAGASIVVANATMMGYIGYRERTSYGLTTRFGFGAEGSRLPSGLLVITSQGWWIIQLLLIMSFWPDISFWKGAGLLIFFGLLMTTTTRTGLQRGMKWLARITIPLLVILCVISIIRSIGVAGGWENVVSVLPKKAGQMSAISGIIMTAALWINGSTMFPDVARYAKSGGAVFTGAAFSFFIGLFGLGFMGLIFFNALQVNDFGPAFAKIGLSAFAFITVFLQLWTTNQNQIYSSSLALANTIRLKRTTCETILLVISLAITVYLSIFPFQSIFIGFLIFLGLFLTPVPGIMAAEYFVINRMKFPENLEALTKINKLSFVTYFLTLAINVTLWATLQKSAPIGLITLNPLTSLIIHLILKSTLGKMDAFQDKNPALA